MPAYLSDLFGTKELGAIHGRILTAWGIAGVVGPYLVAVFREMTKGYSTILYFFAGCFVLNLLLAAGLHFYGKPKAKTLSEADLCEAK